MQIFINTSLIIQKSLKNKFINRTYLSGFYPKSVAINVDIQVMLVPLGPDPK